MSKIANISHGLLVTSMLLTSNYSIGATMRCDRGIISEGDEIFEVINKCGTPANRTVIEPTLGSNGKTANKAVPVENWVYGPNNGAFRYLRFVDGKLVKIETKLQ